MHDSARVHFQRFADKYLDREARLHICDVGSCDVNGKYLDQLLMANWRHTGIDIVAGPNVDIVVGEYDWPQIGDGYFDAVISGSCVEHVRMPWRWIGEVVRIVKPGGLIYLCAPNTWEYHEHPVDCWRIWPEGMRALMEWGGAVVVEAYSEGTDTVCIARKHDLLQ
jgi:2-polyprenyl-3-methyl-5-hydroxy-6-metoxy-1,4-benzoquinol methylase